MTTDQPDLPSARVLPFPTPDVGTGWVPEYRILLAPEEAERQITHMVHESEIRWGIR